MAPCRPGDPAMVIAGEMGGADQATLNRNLLGAMSVLNKGVQFPSDYKNDVFKTADLNTTLQFYRDWIKGEDYKHYNSSCTHPP
jgi:hypothetical protein